MVRRTSFSGMVAVIASCWPGLMAIMCSTDSNAADHIAVTREVFIDAGVGEDQIASPRTIVRTGDGGYVIAGLVGGRAGAVRVDASGVVKWRYALQQFKAGRPVYHGAAMLSDDSTILCGSVQVPVENSDRQRGLGLIAHIDKSGRVFSEQALQSDEKGFMFGGFSMCAAVGNEVIVIGGLAPFTLTEPRKLWLIALDEKGNIKSQTTVSGVSGILVQVLPGNDLLLWDHSYTNRTKVAVGDRLVRIDARGDIKAEQIFPATDPYEPGILSDAKVVTSVTGDSYPRFTRYGVAVSTANLVTLDEQLKTVRQIGGSAQRIIPRRAFYMPDGAMVVFGGKQYEGNTYTATMAWYSPDLNHVETEYVGRALSSFEIVDAVPTGKPGEFATVRFVRPTDNFSLSNEKRHGTVLTFVQVR